MIRIGSSIGALACAISLDVFAGFVFSGTSIAQYRSTVPIEQTYQVQQTIVQITIEIDALSAQFEQLLNDQNSATVRQQILDRKAALLNQKQALLNWLAQDLRAGTVPCDPQVIDYCGLERSQ